MVVAFWGVMMVALVRVEYHPESVALDPASMARVMDKIFSNAEPVRVNVCYRASRIGFCRADISPIADSPVPTNGPASRTAPAYQVDSELYLKKGSFGMRSQLHLKGASVFDRLHHIKNFHLTATMGDGRVSLDGDDVAGKVHLRLDLADLHEDREFDFQNMQAAGLASALGLPGLGVLGGSAPVAAGGAASSPASRISYGSLKIGSAKVRAYVVETRMNESLWARIWISERGEVLKVDTSMELTMLADVFPEETVKAESSAGPRPGTY